MQICRLKTSWISGRTEPRGDFAPHSLGKANFSLSSFSLSGPGSQLSTCLEPRIPATFEHPDSFEAVG